MADDERRVREIDREVGHHARLAGLAVSVARVKEHHQAKVAGSTNYRIQQPAVVQPVVVVEGVHFDGREPLLLSPHPELVDGDLAAAGFHATEPEQPVWVVAHSLGDSVHVGLEVLTSAHAGRRHKGAIDSRPVHHLHPPVGVERHGQSHLCPAGAIAEVGVCVADHLVAGPAPALLL